MKFKITWKKILAGKSVTFTENFHNVELATAAFESLLKDKMKGLVQSISFGVE